MEVPAPKSVLRRQVRAQVQLMTVPQRAAASAQARDLLVTQPCWQQAASVLFYAPMPQELDLWPLLEVALAAGKVAALPRFDPAANCYLACPIRNPAEDLEPGRFGIREPNARCGEGALTRLELLLVPGLAFDLQGRRLGRGRGFYDQLLATVRGPTCGVAFDEQLVSEVPVEPHDVRLDCLLTPTRWLEF